MFMDTGVTDRQCGATDVRCNGAISKCLIWGAQISARRFFPCPQLYHAMVGYLRAC